MKTATARPPRTKFGRYELVRHLASGGMAEVLLARVTGIEGFERHVVLKRIRDEQAGDARFVQMFLEEARLAASLHHHSIVQVHDIGQDDGEYFFAMEYVHGEDLRKLLAHVSERDERVPLEHVVAIVSAAAAALHHAHDQKGPDRKPLGLVHRDVSPANILVGYDGHVKVVDFGIAKATQRSTDETHSGLMKGKVAYMSPEQCVGQPVDRRSDIYCLGIVLYELATVRRLFKGANDFLTMRAITDGEIPRPSELRPDLPPELEAIIMTALADRPADRYQTAGEMRAALDKFAATAGLRWSPAALAEYMNAQFGERPMPWLADEDEPEVELSYDFDGSGSGVVRPPSGFELPTGFVEQSPIMKARTKAITGAPEQSGGLDPAAIVRRASASTAAVAPLRKPARGVLIGVASVVGAVVLIAIIATAARSDEPTPDARPPAVVQPLRPAARTVERVEPVTPPNLIDQKIDPAIDPKIDQTKVEVKPVAAKPKPAVKPRPVVPPKKPARGTWDPNALFPKKQ